MTAIGRSVPPLASARWLGIAVVITVVLGLAELPFAAFMADDLIHLGVLEGVLPCTWIGPFDLYTLSDGVLEHVRAMQNAGAMPWFFSPAFKMTFLRPLTSASVALDHAIWGLWPMGYRLQATAWLVLLVLGVGLTLRRVLPGRLATIALIVFTISGIHGSLFWNATRHIVVAGALGMLGLAAHVRWREAGWRAGRIVSLAGFVLSLLASEAGLAVMVYLLAYEAFGAPREGRRRAVLAPVVLVAVYMVVLRHLGIGTANGAGYLDPLQAPTAFLRELPGRWLFMIGTLVIGGQADLWVLWPAGHRTLIVAGAVVTIGFAWVLRLAWRSSSADDRRGARWLMVGAAVATVPFAGTPIGTRCLVLPFIGGSVAIALVLEQWWLGPRRGRLVGMACLLLAIIHSSAPIGRLVGPYVLRQMLHERLADIVRDAEVDPAGLASRDVVVLRAPDFIVGLHTFFFRTLYRMPMPRSWRTLSWAPYPHRVARTRADTLELELIDGTMEAPGLDVGDVVALAGLRVTVLARGEGGLTRVRFEFDRPLDDASLALLAWRDGALRRVVPPPIGREVVL